MAKKTNNRELSEAQKRSRANLKPFKKGQSGNPKGRPPGSKNPDTVARELLAALAEDNEPLTPVIESIVTILRNEEARDSDRLKAADMLMDRIAGKATQQIDNVSSDGSMATKPQKIELVAPDDDSTNNTTS